MGDKRANEDSHRERHEHENNGGDSNPFGNFRGFVVLVQRK
jgi:hypothetical protein